MNYIPPKLAMISNLTGYGRCSLAVAIPVVSALGVQACPVPTALYSNHLAFPTWFHRDLTEEMPGYLEGFSNLDLSFEGIYYGFVGSEEQMVTAENFFRSQPQAKIILDPAMGDHGKMYSSLTPNHCTGIKRLIPYSHIFTPNLTEACLLTDTEYHAGEWSEDELCSLSSKLHALGAKQIVITGIRTTDSYINYISDGNCRESITHPIMGQPYHGAGDLFSAIISADALQGVPLEDSVKKASAFVGACVAFSEKAGVPEKDGLLFETCLPLLFKADLDSAHSAI